MPMSPLYTEYRRMRPFPGGPTPRWSNKSPLPRTQRLSTTRNSARVAATQAVQSRSADGPNPRSQNDGARPGPRSAGHRATALDCGPPADAYATGEPSVRCPTSRSTVPMTAPAKLAAIVIRPSADAGAASEGSMAPRPSPVVLESPHAAVRRRFADDCGGSPDDH